MYKIVTINEGFEALFNKSSPSYRGLHKLKKKSYFRSNRSRKHKQFATELNYSSIHELKMWILSILLPLFLFFLSFILFLFLCVWVHVTHWLDSLNRRPDYEKPLYDYLITMIRNATLIIFNSHARRTEQFTKEKKMFVLISTASMSARLIRLDGNIR